MTPSLSDTVILHNNRFEIHGQEEAPPVSDDDFLADLICTSNVASTTTARVSSLNAERKNSITMKTTTSLQF